jgi:hypothetical protein
MNIFSQNYGVLLLNYSLTCIKRALKGTWKCTFYEQLLFIYRLKLYAVFPQTTKTFKLIWSSWTSPTSDKVPHHRLLYTLHYCGVWVKPLSGYLPSYQIEHKQFLWMETSQIHTIPVISRIWRPSLEPSLVSGL